MLGSGAKGDSGDVNGGEVEFMASHLPEHVGWVEPVGAGPLQDNRNSVGGPVEDLVDLEDLLETSRRFARILVGAAKEHELD